MRQLARRLRDGRLELVEVADPLPAPGQVAVRVEASIISSGTERATLEVARSGLLAKARARPDQTRQVLERVRREGLRSTAAVVRQRLEELGPLGYSAAGVAVEVGERTRGIAPGDLVAIGGGGYANHAEIDLVPTQLCAKVPDEVSIENAAFATLGAIALNGFRRAEVQIGSIIAVIGLGLIGQLTVRLAGAAGCRVLGTDLEPDLCQVAVAGGADAVPRGELAPASRWHDQADAVVICASSRSDDPIELAAILARERAPVVVVGDVPMRLPRTAFYDKELDLRMARSYGPGRYDPGYELHGLDYPIGQIPWTERRNMEAFLRLVADGRVNPSVLVSHRFPFLEAGKAFELLSAERPLAISLGYTTAGAGRKATVNPSPRPLVSRRRPTDEPRFAILGAGRFATSTLIPGLLTAGLEPVVVASAGGLSAADAKRRFGFETAASGADEVIGRDDLDLVVVATQHDSHADLTARALEVGKAVYVEKPLALDGEGLVRVREAQAASGAPLFVGFNRRYAPLTVKLRDLPGPRLMSYRVNAGPMPPEHWTNDPARGGGRLLGEGCHFIDFLCDQAGSDPASVVAGGFASDPGLARVAVDNFSIRFDFADGSIGSIQYAADAPTGSGKERFETSGPGFYAVMEDFASGRVWRGRRSQRLARRGRDKGFAAQFRHLAETLRGNASPPAPEGYYISTLATLAAVTSLQTGEAAQIVTGGNGSGASFPSPKPGS